MSFLSTQPEALTAAASELQGIGSVLAAQNAAAAAPTTALAPAGLDEVSAMLASQFSAYGSMYQEAGAQASAIHEMIVNTLNSNAGSYATAEAVNAATATASSAASGGSIFDTLAALFAALGSNAMVTNLGGGVMTSVMYIPSSLLPAMIGFAEAATPDVAAAGTGLGALLAPGGALGALGVLGGGAGAAGAAASASTAASAASTGTGAVGEATLVSNLSAPSSWAEGTPSGAAPAAAAHSGYAAAAPESNAVTAMPAGMGGGGSGRAGLGTPRYGSKPVVMPRPVVAG